MAPSLGPSIACEVALRFLGDVGWIAYPVLATLGGLPQVDWAEVGAHKGRAGDSGPAPIAHEDAVGVCSPRCNSQ